MPLPLDICIILALLVVYHFEVLELATLPTENPAGFRHVHLVSRSTISTHLWLFQDILSVFIVTLCFSVSPCASIFVPAIHNCFNHKAKDYRLPKPVTQRHSGKK